MSHEETADAADSGFPSPPPTQWGGKMTVPLPSHSFVDATTPCHDATHLTEGGNLARIVLNGQIYALRITRAGKLILTK